VKSHRPASKGTLALPSSPPTTRIVSRVSARIAAGLAVDDAGVDAFAEAAGRAALGLGGAPADLAVVFGGAPNLAHVEEGLRVVRDRIGAGAVVGCGAQGVLGGGRELEQGGVAVWAASLPGAHVDAFHVEAIPDGESSVAIAGLPSADDADALIVLADPYSFPAESLLTAMAEEQPGLPVVGGLASAGSGPGAGTLILGDDVVTHGAVGVALAGVDVRTCVSQGARPIGPEMVITAAEGSIVSELASKPALERLKEAIAELDFAERALAANGLLLGIVIDENKPEYERGDFLVRGLLGVDEESGAVQVGEHLRVGQTVRLQVRDGTSADEDLRAALGRLPDSPSGALLFTCNGRGSHMFGSPDHDARALDEAFGGAPVAGFFCAGEIGPVGRRNFVHGFTATMAVFA
jgi:small ligand-binding sensory domain FIST